MKECYLATIWHTGTQYFRKGLEKEYRVALSHFNKQTLKQLPDYETVYTTYRDPYTVAASWANRGKFKHKGLHHDVWIEQWTCFRDCLELNPIILDVTKGREQYGITFPEERVNSMGDPSKYHSELARGNVEYLYRRIPKELIDYAIECSGELYKDIDSDNTK